MKKYIKTIIVLLIMSIILPFNVEAKTYKIVLTYIANGGKTAIGNVEIISNVVFLKDSTKAEVMYRSDETINYINSLDKKETFRLEKGNYVQQTNKEWYSENRKTGKRVYFSNSKQYKASEIVELLGINPKYREEKGIPIEIYLKANYTDNVEKVITNIKLDKSSITLKKGKSTTVKATVSPSDIKEKVVWESSDKTIATVDDGKIEGKKAGKVTITAESQDGTVKATVKVEVKDNDDFLNKKSMHIYKDVYYNMNKYVNSDIEKVKWSSSNSKIASVTSDGIIHAKKSGSTTLTAKTSSGKDTINVNVRTQTNNKDYSLSNCSEMDVKSSKSGVKVYRCLSDIRLTNPSKDNGARQIQGLAITNKYIYFSAPINGARLHESKNNLYDTDDETTKFITTVYIARIPRSSKTIEYMRLEYAGHGQGIDYAGKNNDGKEVLYVNYAAKFSDNLSTLESSGETVRSTKYRGIGTTLFEGKQNSATIKHPGRIIAIKKSNNKVVLKNRDDLKVNGKFNETSYYKYVKKVAKNENYRPNPQTSIDDINGKLAVRSQNKVYVYNKSEVLKGEATPKYVFKIEDSGTQGDEITGNYFYTITGKTDVTIKKYNITTGKKVDQTTISFKGFLKDNAYKSIEPEGISFNGGKLYIGLVTKSCKEKSLSSSSVYRYNSIIKVTGI